MHPDARFSDPDAVLRTVFGYHEFRPGQRKIIDAVLAGRDCIGLMPTGAGKSLTFQVPAKILPGTVLVLSPLISLMKDQVDALVRTGFRAAVLNSTLTPAERQATLADLRAGGLDLLYVAPEALGPGLRATLAAARISLIVVDEAHCISHWGHDFRPAYRQLAGLKGQFGDIPILALTATATRQVVGDVIRQLGMRKPEGFKSSFFRPNLIITTQKKGAGRETRADILALIRKHRGESGIVYCLSRKAVDDLTAWLRTKGVAARAYHAGLSDAERSASQEAFARDDASVIVATVAFGMGIDKSNVRYVVHRDLPRSLEGWYQEIGRAGRDGLESDCVLMYSWIDVLAYDRFLGEVDDPELRAATREKTVRLFALADSRRCRHQALAAYFDERIERCGTSCDACLDRDLGALLGSAAPGARARGARVAVARAALGARPRGAGSLALAPATDGAAADGRAAGSTGDDGALFERLRTLRRSIADAEGVPAYIVFSDAVLRAMASARPQDERGLLALSGVGPAKLERYGARFLAALRDGD